MSIVESSHVLEILSQTCDVTLLVPRGLTNSSVYKKFDYQESRLGKMIRDITLFVETMRKSSEVLSFQTRIRTVLGLKMDLNGNYKLVTNNLFGLFFKPRTLIIYLNYLAAKLMFWRKFLRRISSCWPSLNRGITKSNPDCLIIFSGGVFSGVENSSIRKCKKLDIPSILIVDNWDNLNSKSILWETADGFGVWGSNMEHDLRAIHDIHPLVLKHVGSARFRPNEHRGLKLDPDFIFFAGSGKPEFDEMSCVIRIRKTLDDLNLKELRLIFRPHPLSKISLPRLKQICSEYIGIELDSSLTGNLNENFYMNDPLLYLESLCKSAKFVIAPQSTIIVESLSLGTPVISLNWSEVDQNRKPIYEYTHFMELNMTSGFYIAESEAELKSLIPRVLNFTPVNNLVPEILPDFKNCYADRILDLYKLTLENYSSSR